MYFPNELKATAPVVVVVVGVVMQNNDQWFRLWLMHQALCMITIHIHNTQYNDVDKFYMAAIVYLFCFVCVLSCRDIRSRGQEGGGCFGYFKVKWCDNIGIQHEYKLKVTYSSWTKFCVLLCDHSAHVDSGLTWRCDWLMAVRDVTRLSAVWRAAAFAGNFFLAQTTTTSKKKKAKRPSSLFVSSGRTLLTSELSEQYTRKYRRREGRERGGGFSPPDRR